MIIYLKTQAEISGFKKASKEASRILNILLNTVQANVTTEELNSTAIKECQQINAIPTFLNYQGFPAAICTSINKILVHGIPNTKKLEIDDLLSIDLGVTIDGFIGDVAATISVPEYSKNSIINSYQGWTYFHVLTPVFVNNSNLIAACKAALHEAIKKAKPNNKLSDISRAIKTIANKHKFSTPIQYGGHGINRFALHAQPYIPNDPQLIEEDVTLYPGMVLAIEPMFIDSKSGATEVLSDKWSVLAQGNAVHFEHTILVTEEEPIILTDLEAE